MEREKAREENERRKEKEGDGERCWKGYLARYVHGDGSLTNS